MFDINEIRNERIKNNVNRTVDRSYTIQNAIRHVHEVVLFHNDEEPMTQQQIADYRDGFAHKIESDAFDTVEQKVYYMALLAYLNSFEK